MKILLVLLLAAVPFTASTQGFTLADQREHWSIGVAAFEGRNMNPENLYLTRSFPLLLRERLEAIPSHFFSEAEVRANQKRIVGKEQQRLAKAVSDDRRTRDELFFTSEQDKTDSYEERIAANLAAIQDLRELDPEQIPFPESKSLRFVSGANGQLIFDTPVLSPLQLARQADLDALLWGSLEEIQGFLYLEIHVYDAVLTEQVFSYSDAASPTELYSLVDELINELASILWGRDWSALVVETVPAQASVWIDDTFQGRTPLTIPYLLPGRKEMRVQAPGYRTEVRSIELFPYSEAVQQFTLSPQAGDSFSLASDPEGAAVYEGSQFLGTTPLSVDTPDELNRFLLRRDGYLDFPLYAGSGFTATVDAALVPEDVDPVAIQRQRRDELYRAFGAFALSIPVPLFLWGYSFDYRVLAVQTGGPVDFFGFDVQPAAVADGLTYASIGTMTISVTLFVNLMVRLIRYLQAADRKA